MKTFYPKNIDTTVKTYLIDASGKTLGRLATKVAGLLIGKGKTTFCPERLGGDRVVIVNAKKVFVTGKKNVNKIYTHYTGWAGGLRQAVFEDVIVKKPEEIILRAVSRMLPKNKLGARMLKSLRVYANETHDQQAQKPIKID
jgi:large subunit ribosomal protein L13